MKPAYLLVTLGLAVGGWLVLTRATNLDGPLVGIGLGAAWVIQGVGFWILTTALERGGSVVVPWVLGMAARIGGLAILWVAAVATDEKGFDLVVPYALALLVFLLLEAGWLAVRTGSGLKPKQKSTE